LTARLATEAGQHGINVNYIQPGAIMTPDSRRMFKKDKALRDFCIGYSAAKRLGEPIDIAKVALFLATDDSVFVSGTGIVVDGGRSGH
jgi:NAD(P)-dependent dehydrogenase (short-subunit alcohol dehydrogenase family)